MSPDTDEPELVCPFAKGTLFLAWFPDDDDDSRTLYSTWRRGTGLNDTVLVGIEGQLVEDEENGDWHPESQFVEITEDQLDALRMAAEMSTDAYYRLARSLVS